MCRQKKYNVVYRSESKNKNILEMQKGVDMKMDKCFNDEIIKC